MKMAKGKKTAAKKPQATAGKAQDQVQKLKARLGAANQEMVAMKKTLKAKLAGAEQASFNKGYAAAMKQINHVVKAKAKAIETVEHKFEKDFAKVVTLAEPKKAVQGKKAAKARKVTVKQIGKKVSKKATRDIGKTMKRAAATKKVSAAMEANAAVPADMVD
jgi:5-bromo-4-chloroindolyl phosphate hydrolysis protein